MGYDDMTNIYIYIYIYQIICLYYRFLVCQINIISRFSIATCLNNGNDFINDIFLSISCRQIFVMKIGRNTTMQDQSQRRHDKV
jgi:hypothetical protein